MGVDDSEYHGFQSTLWTQVLQAGNSQSPDASAALEQLCQIYWPPLYSYVFTRLKDPHEAEDVTQAFFAQLLERRDLAEVHPERGRFRAFLLASLKNFLSNHWAKKNAQKRGGKQRIFSLDQLPEGVRESLKEVDDSEPEKRFDAQWAAALVQSVYQRLREELDEVGQIERFEVLSRFLFGEVDAGAYAAGAGELGVSESGFRSAVMRLRGRFRDLFRAAVCQTVASPDDVEAEMRHLLVSLS